MTKEVWLSTGFTKNMGNYEAIRADVGIKKIGEFDEEKAFKECEKFVEEKQDELLTEIMTMFKNKTRG